MRLSKKISFYVDLDTYFYTPDQIGKWNRIYTKKGFFKILNLNLDQN